MSLEWRSFVEKLKAYGLTNSDSIYVSLHPQSDDKCGNLITSLLNCRIRDKLLISDEEFLLSCKVILGVKSSLFTFAKELEKKYIILD